MKNVFENLWKASDGYFIVKKSDGEVIGPMIVIEDDADINDFEEVAYTEESYDAFYTKIHRKSPKQRLLETEQQDKELRKAKKSEEK